MRQCYVFGQIVFFSIEDYNTNFKAQLIFKKCRFSKSFFYFLHSLQNIEGTKIFLVLIACLSIVVLKCFCLIKTDVNIR